MHIMEGFLPVEHAVGWTAASAPFVGYGLIRMKRVIHERPEQRMLLGAAAAFTFVLSALKLPSVTGSCSHPTGTGLGAILFGPWVMVPLGVVVLLFQALLLAHGGVTTLGANAFAMAIVGPFVAYGVYRLARGLRSSNAVAIFAAAMLGDMATYLTTSAQLAIAFPDASGGIVASFVKFAGVFAFTQVPLAVSGGLLTVVVFNALQRFDPVVLADLGFRRTEEVAS